MKKVIILTQLLVMLLLNGCTVSYKFNGASIDYTKTKTISVADFCSWLRMVVICSLKEK